MPLVAAAFCLIDPSALGLAVKFRHDSVRCLYPLRKDLENENECDQGPVETAVVKGQREGVFGATLQSVWLQ